VLKEIAAESKQAGQVIASITNESKYDNSETQLVSYTEAPRKNHVSKKRKPLKNLFLKVQHVCWAKEFSVDKVQEVARLCGLPYTTKLETCTTIAHFLQSADSQTLRLVDKALGKKAGYLEHFINNAENPPAITAPLSSNANKQIMLLPADAQNVISSVIPSPDQPKPADATKVIASLTSNNIAEIKSLPKSVLKEIAAESPQANEVIASIAPSVVSSNQDYSADGCWSENFPLSKLKELAEIVDVPFNAKDPSGTCRSIAEKLSVSSDATNAEVKAALKNVGVNVDQPSKPGYLASIASWFVAPLSMKWWSKEKDD